MKRGRAKRAQAEEPQQEEKRRHLRKLADEEKQREEAPKARSPRRLKRADDDRKPERKKERKFEIPALNVGETYEYLINLVDKDQTVRAIVKGAYFKYKDTEMEIKKRKNLLVRSNCPEQTYREEMNKLRFDERTKMFELFDQAIEKLTAAQVRGFESLEALKRKFRNDTAREKPKNVIVELLKMKTEAPEEPEAEIETTPAIKEKLQKRRMDQQEALLKVLKSKLDFPDEEMQTELRMEKAKSLNYTLKKAKSFSQDLFVPSLLRTASFQACEAKAEPIKTERIMLSDMVCVPKLIASKQADIRKNIELYLDPRPRQCMGPYDPLQEPPSIHPCLQEFEHRKLDRFHDLQRAVPRPEEMSHDDLAFLLYLTEECTNRMNQIRVTKCGDLKSFDVHPDDIRRLFDRILT